MSLDSYRDWVLLYDGECGFCDGAVQFILSRDRKQLVRFAPLQGAYAARILERRPDLRTVDSLMVVTGQSSDGQPVVVARSEAVLAIAGYLGGFWRAIAAPARLMPDRLLDGLYDALARRRIRFFGRLEACRIPSPDQRARFLD